MEPQENNTGNQATNSKNPQEKNNNSLYAFLFAGLVLAALFMFGNGNKNPFGCNKAKADTTVVKAKPAVKDTVAKTKPGYVNPWGYLKGNEKLNPCDSTILCLDSDTNRIKAKYPCLQFGKGPGKWHFINKPR